MPRYTNTELEQLLAQTSAVNPLKKPITSPYFLKIFIALNKQDLLTSEMVNTVLECQHPQALGDIVNLLSYLNFLGNENISDWLSRWNVILSHPKQQSLANALTTVSYLGVFGDTNQADHWNYVRPILESTQPQALADAIDHLKKIKLFEEIVPFILHMRNMRTSPPATSISVAIQNMNTLKAIVRKLLHSEAPMHIKSVLESQSPQITADEIVRAYNMLLVNNSIVNSTTNEIGVTSNSMLIPNTSTNGSLLSRTLTVATSFLVNASIFNRFTTNNPPTVDDLQDITTSLSKIAEDIRDVNFDDVGYKL